MYSKGCCTAAKRATKAGNVGKKNVAGKSFAPWDTVWPSREPCFGVAVYKLREWSH